MCRIAALDCTIFVLIEYKGQKESKLDKLAFYLNSYLKLVVLIFTFGYLQFCKTSTLYYGAESIKK